MKITLCDKVNINIIKFILKIKIFKKYKYKFWNFLSDIELYCMHIDDVELYNFLYENDYITYIYYSKILKFNSINIYKFLYQTNKINLNDFFICLQYYDGLSDLPDDIMREFLENTNIDINIIERVYLKKRFFKIKNNIRIDKIKKLC